MPLPCHTADYEWQWLLSENFQFKLMLIQYSNEATVNNVNSLLKYYIEAIKVVINDAESVPETNGGKFVTPAGI